MCVQECMPSGLRFCQRINSWNSRLPRICMMWWYYHKRHCRKQVSYFSPIIIYFLCNSIVLAMEEIKGEKQETDVSETYLQTAIACESCSVEGCQLSSKFKYVLDIIKNSRDKNILIFSQWYIHISHFPVSRTGLTSIFIIGDQVWSCCTRLCCFIQNCLVRDVSCTLMERFHQPLGPPFLCSFTWIMRVLWYQQS